MAVTFDGKGVATIQSQAFIDTEKNKIITNGSLDDDQKAIRIRQIYLVYGLIPGTYYRTDYYTNPGYGGHVPEAEDHTEYSKESMNSSLKYLMWIFILWCCFWSFEKIDDRLKKNHINFSIIHTIGATGQAIVNSTGLIRTEPRTK
jgi:hypothetical protein